jgi:hypothetical protein
MKGYINWNEGLGGRHQFAFVIPPWRGVQEQRMATSHPEPLGWTSSSSFPPPDVNWHDLSRKIRALMHFASVLGADYGDGRGGVDSRNCYKD